MEARKAATEHFYELLLANAGLVKEDGTITKSNMEMFVSEIHDVCTQMFSDLASDDKEGVEELLEADDNPLTTITTTKGVRAAQLIADDVIRHKEQVEARGKLGKQAFYDSIESVITRETAREQATLENASIATIIGIKEAIITFLVEMLGTDITNAVVNKADSARRKKLDDIRISDIIKAGYAGARLQSYKSTTEQYAEVLSFNYNWKNTLERNVEQFQHEASLLESKGITIGPETTVLNLMTNIEEAIKHDWAEPLKEPFRRMMIKYANKKHDETSQAAVLAEFAKAEKYRVISDAPGTTTSNFEEANAVFDMYEDNFYGNFDSDTDTDGGRSNVSSAYATSSASDSSGDEQYTRRSMQLKKKEQVAKERKAARRAKEAKEAKEAEEKAKREKKEKKGKSKTKRSKEDSKSDKDVEELMEALNYGCKHCVRKRKAFIHPEPPSKCKWNEKAKVFRSQRVCDQLGLTFKPKDKFSYDNGGYAPLSSYKSAAEATAAESDSE